MNSCVHDNPGAQLPFRISNPQLIPVERYYNEEFYQLECERLWPHVWQMACRLEQIQNLGDWVEYKNAGKSVVVVRSESGIKVFHNACRHRGVALTTGSHGNLKGGFVCPFHGWRWDMEGQNTVVYGRHLFSDDVMAKEDLALSPVRHEVWGGCVFINFDDRAPSLRDHLGPVAERLEAHGVDNLRAEWWYATELPANWKVAMEAFQEGFHVMRTHPQLQQASPNVYNSRYAGIGEPINTAMSTRQNVQAQFDHMERLGAGMAGMVHAKEVAIARQLLDVELPEDPREGLPLWFGMLQDQITRQLRAQGEPVPELNAVCVSDPVEAVEFIFPHYFLLPFFTSMSSYRVRPLGPERCLFEIWSLTSFPEGQEPSPPLEPILLPYDSQEFPEIPQQDFSNIPLQQQGIRGGGLSHLRLAQGIEGLISNYQRIIDGYLSGKPGDQLARATQQLGGNFDGPIKDLGW